MTKSNDDASIKATFELADKFIKVVLEGGDADVEYAHCIALAYFIFVTRDSEAAVREAIRRAAEDMLKLALDRRADLIAAAQAQSRKARLQ